jgi:hypothetical protein
MDNDKFNLNIVGRYGKTVTTSEVKNFPTAVWTKICAILADHGLEEITTANLDAAGTKITLPSDVFKGAGVR